MTDGATIEETGSEISINLPSYKYKVDSTTEIGSDITICSSNKNNFYQARYGSLLTSPAPGEFCELQPLAFEVNPTWQSVNSATWAFDTQNIDVPEIISNGFATLVKGKSQSHLLINDHLLGGNEVIGRPHKISIRAQKLTPTPTAPPGGYLKLDLLKVWFWKQEPALGRGHEGTVQLALKQGGNVVLEKVVKLDENGEAKNVELPGVTAGTYDTFIFEPGYLTKKLSNVTLNQTGNTLDFTKNETEYFLVGDFNGDREVNILDFSIFVKSYGKQGEEN